ncbi:MAG: DNA polymerase III subunit delta' [Peptococcaceae bacterium]|nr:DNA polymerase III subunit delta' [Peptococcaceae bacterium]
MSLAIRLLAKAAGQDQLAHCLLFHGGSRQARREMGLRLAMILNCRESGERPCQRCISCRKILSGNHPDVRVLEPDKESLRMDQVRIWQNGVYRKHFEGRYKVFIFAQADSLTVQAANALLKVVEEPPDRTVIILSADNLAGILPTLQSRSQIVYFPDPPKQDWFNAYTNEDAEDAALAWSMSGENPDVAQRILSAGVASVQEWLTQFWQGIEQKDFILLFPLWMKGKAPDRHLAGLYLRIMGLRIKNEISLGRSLAGALLTIEESMEALRRNVNPRLVMEVCALKLMDGYSS